MVNKAFDQSLSQSLGAFYFLYETLKYPSGSIRPHQPGDEHFEPDVTIVDPGSNEILAYLELVPSSGLIEMPQLAMDYIRYISRSKISVPAFLALPSGRNEHESKFYVLSSESWEPIRREDFPNFQALKSMTNRIVSQSDDSPKAQISKEKSQLPEKVTVAWLLQNISIGQWSILLGLIIGSFVIGARFGVTPTGKDLLKAFGVEISSE